MFITFKKAIFRVVYYLFDIIFSSLMLHRYFYLTHTLITTNPLIEAIPISLSVIYSLYDTREALAFLFFNSFSYVIFRNDDVYTIDFVFR